MTYMGDGKTPETAADEIVKVSDGETLGDGFETESDGFETVYPKMAKAPKAPKAAKASKPVCGRVLVKTHYQTITCEQDPGHPPPCEGKGIRR